MATVDLDNLDEVLAVMAKLETKSFTEVVRNARKGFRAVLNSEKKAARQNTPVGETGELSKAKNLKVKSRTRKGVTSVRLNWQKFYGPFVNFKKNQSGEKYATDYYLNRKQRLNTLGRRVVVKSFADVMTDLGFKVKLDGI